LEPKWPAILSVTRLSWKAWQKALADRKLGAVPASKYLRVALCKLALARDPAEIGGREGQRQDRIDRIRGQAALQEPVAIRLLHPPRRLDALEQRRHERILGDRHLVSPVRRGQTPRLDVGSKSDAWNRGV